MDSNPLAEDRIGVSTLFMPAHGVSLWEALDLAHEAGFGSITPDYLGKCARSKKIFVELWGSPCQRIGRTP